MIPHTLVLEPGLRIYKVYNGYGFFAPADGRSYALDLRAVLQRCRLDWDIGSPEQRDAWAKGPGRLLRTEKRRHRRWPRQH